MDGPKPDSIGSPVVNVSPSRPWSPPVETGPVATRMFELIRAFAHRKQICSNSWCLFLTANCSSAKAMNASVSIRSVTRSVCPTFSVQAASGLETLADGCHC